MSISIHAPLTGSDRSGSICFNQREDFNPRSPYGERLFLRRSRGRGPQFQSTLPLRGATNLGQYFDSLAYISIHAPLTGSDSKTAQNFT